MTSASIESFNHSPNAHNAQVPILSICIPTYNRERLLSKTLASIVSQKIFQESSDVEIVVSDNASSDETSEILKKYQNSYPDKINSIRLKKPIDVHLNHENCLRFGRGEFLKLHNDSLEFLPDGLNAYLEIIRDNRTATVILACGRKTSDRGEIIASIDELIRKLSYDITWIGAYCFRREDFAALKEPFRLWQQYFPHMDILLRLLKSRCKVVACKNKYMKVQGMKYNNRNEAEIFGYYYLDILEKYIGNNMLDRKTFDREKRVVLFDHIIPFYFDFFNQYSETHYGLRKYWESMKKYHNNIYFYISFSFLAIYHFYSKMLPVREISRKLKQIAKSIFRCLCGRSS